MSNPTPDSVAITQRGSFPRDDNSVPITQLGLATSKVLTFTGNNTTVDSPIFTITGTVLINALYGVVSTTIGANHTGGLFRLNDQTAQVAITATGLTLSGLAVGTTVVKKGLAAAAAALLDNAAGRVSEPTTLETLYFSPFVAMKKTGATTQIEYEYATTDTPTSGAVTFYCSWVPISADGRVTPV